MLGDQGQRGACRLGDRLRHTERAEQAERLEVDSHQADPGGLAGRDVAVDRLAVGDHEEDPALDDAVLGSLAEDAIVEYGLVDGDRQSFLPSKPDGVVELLALDAVDVDDADADPVARDAQAHTALGQLVLAEERLELVGQRLRVANLAADDDSALERPLRELDELGVPVVHDLGGCELRGPDGEADELLVLRGLPVAAAALRRALLGRAARAAQGEVALEQRLLDRGVGGVLGRLAAEADVPLQERRLLLRRCGLLRSNHGCRRLDGRSDRRSVRRRLGGGRRRCGPGRGGPLCARSRGRRERGLHSGCVHLLLRGGRRNRGRLRPRLGRRRRLEGPRGRCVRRRTLLVARGMVHVPVFHVSSLRLVGRVRSRTERRTRARVRCRSRTARGRQRAPPCDSSGRGPRRT